jgi:hypothetical protein
MNPASASLPSASSRPISQIPPSQPVVNEDDELELIMRDVGAQLKKEELKSPKRRLFSFGHKPKREVPFSAQIVHNPQQFHKPQPAPAQPIPLPRPVVAAAPHPRPKLTPQPPKRQPGDDAGAQLAKIQPHSKAQTAPKPKKQKSYPVFVLFVTFLVTGFLIVAAFAAYRQ